MWDGQLVFMTERYRYASRRAAQECIPPFLFTQCFVLKIAQQAVMQTFLGKGLFLSVAPMVLITVSWKLDKAHFGIVLIR